jgi:hypothetical protein
MYYTIRGKSSWRIPAVLMCTRCLFACLVDILSEIQELHWVDFLACSVLKVFVWDLAIAIEVKVRENFLELVISHEKSPMIQVVLELIRLNGSWFFLIQVRESLFESFPLELNFLQNCLNKIHLLYGFIKNPFIDLLISLIDDLHVFLVLWVSLGIMTEVEALWLLNFTSHPLAEVCIIDLSLLLMILVNDQLRKVFKVHILIFTPEEAKNVINSHEAIIVAV